MSRVLIVDDEKSMRITLSEFLKKEDYEADTASDAQTALQMLSQTEYDIVVTDIIMPRTSGIELLEKIRESSSTVQIVIMTGEPTVETAVKAVQSGANDYLTKPIHKDIFLKTIRNMEKMKQLTDEKAKLEEENKQYQKSLEEMIVKRTNALQDAMQGIISLLSSVVEVRDPYTAGHQRRVGNLSAAIGEKMKLDEKTVALLRMTGYIHDIGKIAIPAEILSKPGTLNDLEIQMIRTHPVNGYEMMRNVDLPEVVGETIYQHHERCDGSGYPKGMKENEISIEAQILMVADVVEAMMSHRPYRPAMGLSKALEEIETNSGTLYHAEVVAACAGLFHEDNYAIDDSEHKVIFPL